MPGVSYGTMSGRKRPMPWEDLSLRRGGNRPEILRLIYLDFGRLTVSDLKNLEKVRWCADRLAMETQLANRQ